LRRLKGKDLITIGIFSAVYFAINLVFMICGGIHPILFMLMPALIALFTGVPYMLLSEKVQKPLAILIMGMITGLIYFASGTFTVVILITFVSACLLAELIRFCTGYESFKGNAASFVVFSLGMIGSPLPIWLFKEDFLAQIVEQGISESYAETFKNLATPVMLVIMIVSTVACAIVGAFLAGKLFKKHFRKAGIVS